MSFSCGGLGIERGEGNKTMTQTRDGEGTTNGLPPRGQTLATTSAGKQVVIDALHAGRMVNRRLAEVGLRSGALVEVVQNLGLDGVIVGLGSERLALPRTLAASIRIADNQENASETSETTR